jgi:hypothetical protein
MHRSPVRFTVLLIVALVTIGGAVRSAAQSAAGSVRGTAVDQSAGVLPGVTVVATSADGQTLATVVTNSSGEFRFDGLPTGTVHLVFHLDGFKESRTQAVVLPGDSGPGSQERLVHRMDVQALTESVIVRGDPPPPLPPPRPVLLPVPDHDQASVCGPAKAEAGVTSFGTVRSRKDDETKVLFAAGDELLIDGGAQRGVAVGQNFVVRRLYPTALRFGRNKSLVVMGEHSSGLLQVVSVEDQVSTAVVVYACDEVMRGDYLTAFEPEPARVSDPSGTPAFDQAIRILFADAGQSLGVTGRMMVIDGGARVDLRAGQRVTLFRRSRHRDARPLVIGEAVVVAVRKDSATIRVEFATDVVFFGESGDWAAPQHPASHASN